MVIGTMTQLGRIRFQENLLPRENQSEVKIKSKSWRKQNYSGENSSPPFPRTYKKQKPIWHATEILIKQTEREWKTSGFIYAIYICTCLGFLVVGFFFVVGLFFCRWFFFPTKGTRSVRKISQISIFFADWKKRLSPCNLYYLTIYFSIQRNFKVIISDYLSWPKSGCYICLALFFCILITFAA